MDPDEARNQERLYWRRTAIYWTALESSQPYDVVSSRYVATTSGHLENFMCYS
jgi:hypothetical protein